MKTMLIAIGGNSLIRAGEKGSIADQQANARRTARAIVELLAEGHSVVITHGNGPQVGAQLIRSERSADQVPGQTLDVCGAASQGEIGYILTQALTAELALAGLQIPVASLITRTVVSANDPAMHHPTKPVGPFYTRGEAEVRIRHLGWTIVEDAERGYRRVVPSPDPIEIVELPVIRELVNAGVLVVACGGGGIPVVRTQDGYLGIEAVIDKDPASALMANALGAETLVISTATDFVYLDFKKPAQRPLRQVRLSELLQYFAAGQFPPGSMGPKIEAARRFLQGGGREVIITSYENFSAAVAGTSGTHILPDAATPASGATADQSPRLLNALPVEAVGR